MLYTRYLVPTDIPQIMGSKCFSQIYTLFFNTFAAADEYTRFPCLANFAGLFFSRLAKIAKAEYIRFPEFPQIARHFFKLVNFGQISALIGQIAIFALAKLGPANLGPANN